MIPKKKQMRGSKAQIRIFEENRITRRLLVRSMILYNVCAVIIYLINKEISLFKYLVRSVPEVSAVYYLFKISAPVITFDGKVKTLVSPGTSLNSKGHVSIVFDFLFVSMLIKLLCLYSDRSWFLYAFVIFSTGYEFVYKPFMAFRKNGK